MDEQRDDDAKLCREIPMLCRDDEGRPHLLSTTFTYQRSEPFAVTIVFRTQGTTLPWTFARDLLMLGQVGPVGDGDVRVRPGRDSRGVPQIAIRLSSPDGQLVVVAATADVRSFLDATLRICPRGQEGEHLDVDGLVDELLSAT